MTELCKILFDLCFYYTLSGYYLYVFTDEYPSNWGIPVLILTAAAYVVMKRVIGNKTRSEGVRAMLLAVVCCAMPVLLLVFKPTIWQIAQYAPAWAFLGFTVWTGRIYTDRSEFERHFKFTGKILCLIIPGFIAISSIGGALTGAIPYFVIYLLAGVCLMRILRDEGKLTTGRHIAVMLIVLTAGVVLTILQTPQLLATVLGFVYKNIIVWVLMGIVVVLLYFLSGLVWLFSLLGTSGEQEPPEISITVDDIFGDQLEGASMSNASVWLEIAAVIVLALAVAFILFLIMRRLLGNKSHSKRIKPYKEEQERLQKQVAGKKYGIFRRKDQRQFVRYIYKKYLKEGASRGLSLVPSDTSLSVLRKYSEIFALSESADLRDIYIKARYRFSEETLKADSDAAAEIWRRLK